MERFAVCGVTGGNSADAKKVSGVVENFQHWDKGTLQKIDTYGHHTSSHGVTEFEQLLPYF